MDVPFKYLTAIDLNEAFGSVQITMIIKRTEMYYDWVVHCQIDEQIPAPVKKGIC